MREKIQLDANILGDEMFPNARLNEMINQAQWDIQIKLNGIGLKKWAKTYTPETISDSTWGGYNVSYISMPTDYMEGNSPISATTVYSGTNGYASEILSDLFEERLRNSYTTPTTRYPVFTRMDNKYYFYPRVTTINFRYYKRIPELSSDSAESEIPLEYHNKIVDKVVLEIKKIKNNQLYAYEDKKLDKEIEETFIKKERNKQEVKNDAK